MITIPPYPGFAPEKFQMQPQYNVYKPEKIDLIQPISLDLLEKKMGKIVKKIQHYEESSD